MKLYKKLLSRFSSLSPTFTRTRVLLLISLICFALFFLFWWKERTESVQRIQELSFKKEKIAQELVAVSEELFIIQNEDQKVRNDQLDMNLKDLQKANAEAVVQYERILAVKDDGASINDVEKKWAEILTQLSKNDYTTASTNLGVLKNSITDIEKKLAEEAALRIPIPNAPVNNQAPAEGFQQQRVETSVGTFTVSLIAGDLSSTRVIVDTASSGDCTNDCPVLSLAEYVSRNGAFAGVNGTYFCPASYPSCVDKKNTFDLLVMNKDKVYFNSDNNVYSTNPAVIFHGGSISFVSAASSWGRDTGIDSMLSNFPLLVSGNEVRFGGDGDPKKGSKSNRSFVANRGNTVYIGVVHGATVAESAIALKTLGMDNALNLDSGGSTALWAGGYKAGPGRAIPNAILFVRK